MTSDEFHTVFQSVFSTIPEYANSSIRNFVDKHSLEVLITFSDEAVDKAGEKNGTRYLASILVASDSRWHFAFRESLGSAPETVLTTLIQHELIHGFLIAEECSCTDNGQSHLNHYRKQLELLAAKEPSIMNDPDEALIGVINMDWGGDEVAALDWIQKTKMD